MTEIILTEFEHAFYSEDIARLRRIILRNPSLLATEMSSIGVHPLLQLAFSHDDWPVSQRWPEKFSTEFTAFIIDMGFDLDSKCINEIDTFVELGWKALNTAVGAQIILGKIKNDGMKGITYEPNLDIILYDVGEKADRREHALGVMAKIHEAVRIKLLAPETHREEDIAKIVAANSPFRFPFPYKPEHHSIFAGPSAERIALRAKLRELVPEPDKLIQLDKTGATPRELRGDFQSVAFLNTSRLFREMEEQERQALRHNPRVRFGSFPNALP